MDSTTQIENNYDPLVSILMLTYNRAQYIEEAISSAIKQTHQNWELIIIDDGSTDNTTIVVDSFKEKRIRYIRNEKNKGLFVRRQESLSYVKGKYIAVLDSDDYWIDENKIKKQVDILENNSECVVIGTFANLINAKGSKIGQSNFAVKDKLIRKLILFRNQFVHSAVMLRTETVRKTNGYQPTLAEDLELILQLGKFGTLANIPQNCTAHRVHEESANDHGKKMLNAVQTIISKHQSDYPYSFLAKILNKIKLILIKFKQIPK